MIVGTAGHIDHGKTALVRAATGIDTDRLPEEKARGITIDLGFAYRPVSGIGTLGFVDVPGHERFVHNMVAGAAGVDFVLLVIAADDGPMPQTREHLQIVDLLGGERGVVALCKSDLVNPNRIAEVSAALRSLLTHTRLAVAEIVPVSIATEHGVAHLKRGFSKRLGTFRRAPRPVAFASRSTAASRYPAPARSSLVQCSPVRFGLATSFSSRLRASLPASASSMPRTHPWSLGVQGSAVRSISLAPRSRRIRSSVATGCSTRRCIRRLIASMRVSVCCRARIARCVI